MLPHRWSRLAVAVVTLVTVAAGCDHDDGRQLEVPTSDQRAAMTTSTTTTTLPAIPGDAVGQTGAPASVPAAAFTLTAPWTDGGAIDARFTCDGADVSPALSWTAPPAGTAEMALLVTDDDAGGFVHWSVAGIPPAAGGVGEGQRVPRAIEGTTGFDEIGWGGPCPPSGTHTYRFILYALSQQAEVAEGFSAEDLAAYTQTSSLGAAEITGTYTKQ